MKHILIGAIVFMLSTQAQAEEMLSLDEIITKVKSYNQDLKLQQKETKIAQYKKREAIGQALPQVSANISHTQNFSVPTFNIPGQGVFQLQGDYGMIYDATVDQALYTFGAVKSSIEAAKAGLEMLDHNREAVKLNVEYMAKMGYLQVLLAKRNLKINQNLLNNAKENYRILRENFRGGRPPQSDMIRLQADIESKKPLVENSKTSLKNAYMALNILMGESPYNEIEVQGSFRTDYPVLAGPVLQNAVKKTAPALKAIEKNLDFQSHLADVQRAATLPKLSLRYNYNKNDQSYTDRFATDRTLKTSSVTVNLSWNIWDGGISRTAYQRAKVEASKAKNELTKKKDDLSKQVLSALEQFKTYKSNIKYNKNAISLARKSFDLSQNRFQSGQATITELNDTQSVLLQAEQQETANLFQLNSTYALIESLVGKDL